MNECPRIPPSGIEPIDEYGAGLSACRTEDKNSLIIYPDMYKPESDPDYEDPKESAFAWQNQGDAMDQLNWLKKIHGVIGVSEPTSHPRVQRLVEIQNETGFPVVEFISQGDLYSFVRANPNPKVPSGKGSDDPLALKLRWALNIATALSFLHTKSIIFEGLSPNTIHLRSDLSAALVNLDAAAYKEQPGSDGVADGYLSPGWSQSPLAGEPETWVTVTQDIFAFGSLLYFLVEERDHGGGVGFKWEEEDIPELDMDEAVGNIVRKCWTKGFESMDEVVGALRDIIVERGLELSESGDDVFVDSSVEGFEACGIFSQMVRRFEQS